MSKGHCRFFFSCCICSIGASSLLAFWLPVVLFSIYILNSFHRFHCLVQRSRVCTASWLGRALSKVSGLLTAVNERLTAWRLWAVLGGRSQTEGDSFGGVLTVVHNVVGGNWLRLVTHALPVHASEEWVRFERVVTLHSKSRLRFKLQKLVNEGLEIVVGKVSGPLELAAKDLVEDHHLSLAEEGRLAARHLVQDHAQGPEVGEGTGLGLV